MQNERHGVGTLVDRRYKLRREVARGAAGVVYEAEHIYTRRSVAVKLLTLAYLHVEEARSRLLREAEALATALHPCVVEVLDAGDLEDLGPYVVMELLEGRTLQGILAVRQRIGLFETVHLGRHICEALTAAHARGVIHRDIKPSNLLIARDETGREVIKIIDFGIARVSTDDRKLTLHGAVLGTPEYMAPEQMLGEVEIDARVDIYALGVTLYECLTGSVPHEGNFGEVLLKSATEPLTPIRTRNPMVSSELASVVERAMARDPNARYPNMGAFLEAISQIQAQDTGSTLLGIRPPRPPGRPPPLSRSAMPAVVLGPTAGVAGPPQLPPDQRRRFPRAPYVTPVRILRAAGKNIDGRSEDISVGGLLVVLSSRSDQDELVKVRFALPITGKLVEVQAVTKWVKTARGTEAVGLQFTAIPPDIHETIQGYVTSMCGV